MRVLQQRSCGLGRWTVAQLFLSLQAARGGQVSHLPLLYLHLYCFLFTCLGLCKWQQPLDVYPEELNEFAEQPAGNFQRDKAIFCTPTSSTENPSAENEELGLFEHCGSLQH